MIVPRGRKFLEISISPRVLVLGAIMHLYELLSYLEIRAKIEMPVK